MAAAPGRLARLAGEAGPRSPEGAAPTSAQDKDPADPKALLTVCEVASPPPGLDDDMDDMEELARRFLRDHFLLDLEQVNLLPKTEAGRGSALEIAELVRQLLEAGLP